MIVHGSNDTILKLTAPQATAYASPCWRAKDTIQTRFYTRHGKYSVILTVNK